MFVTRIIMGLQTGVEMLALLHLYANVKDRGDIVRPSYLNNTPAPSPDDQDDTLQPDYFVFSFTLLLVFLVVIGNSITILVFSSTPKLCDQTGICLINLAIADLLTGVIFMPVSLPCSLNGDCLLRTNRPLCLSVVITSYTCIGVSYYTLVVISIDRCLQISRPLRYNIILTRKRILLIIVLMWIVNFIIPCCCILASPQIIVFNENYYHCGLDGANKDSWPFTYLINIFTFIISLTIISGCSIKIATIAHRARCSIATQEAIVVSGNARGQRDAPAPVRRLRSSDVRVLVRIFVVVVAFIIFFLPFNIELAYARHTLHMFSRVASMITMLLVEVHSAVNPIIYVTTYEKFRRVFKAKFARHCLRFTRTESAMWTVSSHRDHEYTLSTRRETPSSAFVRSRPSLAVIVAHGPIDDVTLAQRRDSVLPL